ncbi:hypothetical protein MRB53_036018 [Persea americana]|uniref:Uncharacterized protein n=1 Tax=Persea americana TaxID=3435 RepID=A0ACC2K6F0_PERAE|nr:hypothetical protein MRB53_036018 [Persea americana]
MMRRSRVSEMPQRQSLRAPLQRRTSSSESLGDRCSPRNPLVEKKLRTRISDLESQLGQVQEELKSFKEQLASPKSTRQRSSGGGRKS